MRIVNIKYDVDVQDVMEYLTDMTYDKVAEIVEIPKDTWANMTTSEQEDYLYDMARHNHLEFQELIGLSAEMELPDGEWVEETITDYISNESGYCIFGWNYEHEI